MQEGGVDGPLQTFRTILQNIEAKGTVDYNVGGFSVLRPPEVQQGKAPDHFVVKPEEGNPVVWRPQAVQAKNLKATNIASYFAYSALTGSPLKLAPWLWFCAQWL